MFDFVHFSLRVGRVSFGSSFDAVVCPEGVTVHRTMRIGCSTYFSVEEHDAPVLTRDAGILSCWVARDPGLPRSWV